MAQPETPTRLQANRVNGCAWLTLLLSLLAASLCQAGTHEEAEAAIRMRDFEKAAQIYLELAQAGDKEAQFALGNFYRSGRGVKKDHQQAFAWFSKAAEQGHVKAQYTTGTLYENGWGVKADTEKAKAWYARAAEG
ncbi:MAG: tetratricopeptide repeat protein, partial [Candidatus Thiodiazotropha sp.]